MAQTIRSFATTITVTNGVGETTTTLDLTLKNSGGYIEQVIVNPRSDIVQYDFVIENPNSRRVYVRRAVTGDIFEDRHIPARGIYTLKIENAASITGVSGESTEYSGVFDVELMIREAW